MWRLHTFASLASLTGAGLALTGCVSTPDGPASGRAGSHVAPWQSASGVPSGPATAALTLPPPTAVPLDLSRAGRETEAFAGYVGPSRVTSVVVTRDRVGGLPFGYDAQVARRTWSVTVTEGVR